MDGSVAVITIAHRPGRAPVTSDPSWLGAAGPLRYWAQRGVCQA